MERNQIMDNGFDYSMAQISAFGVVSVLLAIVSSTQIFTRRASHGNMCRTFCMIMSFLSSIATLLLTITLYVAFPAAVASKTVTPHFTKNIMNETGNTFFWLFFFSYTCLLNAIHAYAHGIFCGMVSRVLYCDGD